MGRAGSPIYKGELGDYDLPFVRSFQLFCPIKISIFSPIAATLAGSPFAVSLTPPLSFRPFLPGHPPYGNIDRAQPRDSSPSHPRLSCYIGTAFSPSLFLSISFSLCWFLSFSFSPLHPPPLSLCLCLYLRYSGFNIQLLATRMLVDHSQKVENEVAYDGFCVHTNGCVFHCPPASDYTTIQKEGNRGIERERIGKSMSGRRVRRRASWQKSETNEQRSVRRGFPCKCDRAPGSRNGHGTRCDTQCFKEPNRIEGT